MSFFVYSCQNKPNKKDDQKNADVGSQNKHDDVSETTEFDTVRLKYSQHSELLSALTKIPDSSMRSWKWSKKERQQFLESFRDNGFFVDTKPVYNDIIEITPNRLKTQVVDGIWVFAIYRINPKNKIVITNDIVSGGNDIMFFYLQDNEITTTDFNKLIPEFYEAFILQKNSSCAEQILESNYFALADYEFKNDGLKVELWENDDYEQCIKSYSEFFKFRPEKGIFELENK